jgi:molybdopterin molybdotransferase
VREAGAVIRKGARLVARGQRVGENEWALLAACGYDAVKIVAPPAVPVVAVGSELESPGHPDVTGRFLVRFLARLGMPAVYRGVVPDDESRIRREVVDALRRRLVLVTGGTGRGLTDTTVTALRPGGIRILCEGINLRPGGTTAAAVGLRGAGLFLPGSPGAALAVAHLVVKPILADWLGLRLATWRSGPRLPLAEPWSCPSDDYTVLPGRYSGGALSISAAGAEEALLSAETRVLIPPGSTPRTEGVVVDGVPES